MSGHSKWATIHRQKESNDAKKGAIFTKLAAAITVAVKEGRGLQLALEKAKQYNMPKENIQRALDRVAGADGVELEEVMYEGFGPGGGAIIVEAMTDNKLRTAQAVRVVFEKNGGTMGGSGAVSYLFEQKGELRIRNPIRQAQGEQELGDNDELKIIDLNVEEIVKGEGEWIVYCHKDKTFEIKESHEKMEYKIDGVGLVMKPMTLVDGEAGNLIEQLEGLDDIHEVWTNYPAERDQHA